MSGAGLDSKNREIRARTQRGFPNHRLPVQTQGEPRRTNPRTLTDSKLKNAETILSCQTVDVPN